MLHGEKPRIKKQRRRCYVGLSDEQTDGRET